MFPDRKYEALTIGMIFTIVSMILAFTIIVPAVSVLPGLLFEKIAASLVSNEPYRNVGRLAIAMLSMVLGLYVLFVLKHIRKQTEQNIPVSKSKLVLIMSYAYFLIHSLGFYLYWGIALHFRSDGQLLFGATTSFMFSSFAFIVLGFLIDQVKNTTSHA